MGAAQSNAASLCTLSSPRSVVLLPPAEVPSCEVAVPCGRSWSSALGMLTSCEVSVRLPKKSEMGASARQASRG